MTENYTALALQSVIDEATAPLRARISDLEAAIARVMKLPQHAHDGHWCGSNADVLRALGDMVPAPTGEQIAELLGGLGKRVE